MQKSSEAPPPPRKTFQQAPGTRRTPCSVTPAGEAREFPQGDGAAPEERPRSGRRWPPDPRPAPGGGEGCPNPQSGRSATRAAPDPEVPHLRRHKSRLCRIPKPAASGPARRAWRRRRTVAMGGPHSPAAAQPSPGGLPDSEGAFGFPGFFSGEAFSLFGSFSGSFLRRSSILFVNWSALYWGI